MAKPVKNKKRDSLPTLRADAATAPQQPTKTIQRIALSGWPMILGWLAMIIFTFHACTHMVGAGDTWVAMACGRHFLKHGVDTVEPFSANSHKAGPTEKEIKTWPGWAQWIANKVGLKTVKRWHPTGWVNQNWLTHVIFYWLTHESPFADADTRSFNTLVYWKFAIYIITVICVYYTGRLLGANPALCALFACFAMFVSRSYLDVRPAGFSNMLVAVLLLILVLTAYRNILYIWLIVPVVVFWCNVHGGYIYAFIVLIPFIGWHFLTAIPKKHALILYNIVIWPAFLYYVTHINLKPYGDEVTTGLFFKILFYVAVLVVFDLMLAFRKDRLVSIGLKGFYHAVAAYFAAFTATIIFNPFHLTNLTHTFVISASEHAKMWRTVNEWHPAFEFTNPVGTGFPFLGLYTLSIGLLVLWVLSRLLKPRFLKAPKNELEAQKKSFTILSTIFACTTAILVCLVVFISFSFVNVTLPGPDGVYGTNDEIVDVASLLICVLFAVILLLSVFASVHFIYLVVPFVLLALWSADAARGYVGRYIYPFVLLPAYVTLHIFVSLFSKRIKIKSKNIISVAATTLVALALMVVILNPFKHGLLFSVGSEFEPHLDNRIIPQALRQTFQANQAPLSQHVRVSVEELSSRWKITDEPNKYSVRKQGTKLNIYKGESPVWRTKQLLRPHRLRRIWRPVYERNLGLTYTHVFSVLYIVNIASIIIFLMFPYLRSILRQIPDKNDEELQADTYQLPKIDLALIVVAALTIYMAIRSRRFIPIAAIASCPLMAMFIDQMTRTISAAHNFHKHKRLAVSPMPYNLQLFFTVAAVVAVLAFGTGWGLQFKRVYLDPWPTDAKLNSVFMRMTASDAKPFYACQFIRDNNLEGKMFNYWTEGGFIAWGQNPDPNTGKTPLQLFMDGRAQAAYEPATYKLWSDIMEGGPNIRSAKMRKDKLTRDHYIKAGEWIGQRLTDHNVWVVLMPSAVWDKDFVKGLEHNNNWPIVFLNNKQKLFVDRTTTQGKQLFEAMSNNKLRYPNDFSKSLTLAHNMLLSVMGIQERQRLIQQQTKSVKAKLDHENNIIKAKTGTVTEFKQMLDELSEQLRTVDERLKAAKQQAAPELEELQKQKQQIEEQRKTVETRLNNENSIIQVREKAVAQLKKQLTDLLEQSKEGQKRVIAAKQQGLAHAMNAFKIENSQAPMQKILFAGRFSDLRPHVYKFCKDCFDDFVKNQNLYANQHGYFHRLAAILNVISYLELVAKDQKNEESEKFYADKKQEYVNEKDRVLQTKRW